MTDKVTREVRSRMMAAVKSRDTMPELTVRKALHSAGLRYRLHRRDLPGRPDIVLPRHKTAVFVHGCFWHGHDCSKGRRRPATRPEFWNKKLDANISRDQTTAQALRSAGWRVETIWECSLQADIERVLAVFRDVLPAQAR